MEDPNLLEETSSLLDPSEAGRGAPLRLGYVFFHVKCDKSVVLYD